MADSKTLLSAAEVVPGTLYYWRSWRVGGEQIQVARYRLDAGQLVWGPELARIPGAVPRPMAVIVDGVQVEVTALREVLSPPEPRLQLDYRVAGEAGGGVQVAELSLTEVMRQLLGGWELVRAKRVQGGG